MLLLSALFFRPARDKCTYSINKAGDLKCSPTLGKKEKCEVLSAFSISSSHTEFAQTPDEKLLLFFSWSPWGCASPFLHGDFRGNHSTAAQPCLCKVTPPFLKVHVIYCSHQGSFCMDIEGKSSELETLWAPSQGSANTISAFPPSSSACWSFNTHTERQFCSLNPSLMQ